MARHDQSVLEQIQYLVLEPPDGGQSWPSQLWDRDEVLGYLDQRQNRLLKLTHFAVGEAAPEAVGIGVTTLTLPQDLLRVVRVVWVGDDGTVRPVERSEDQVVDRLPPTATFPLVYLEGLQDTLTLTIAPAPSGAGEILVQYVASAPPLSGDGELFVTPDSMVPIVMWGALADMVGKVGRGQDLSRARHAEQRFQLGVEAVRLLLSGRG